jgi:membrane dipeptidase
MEKEKVDRVLRIHKEALIIDMLEAIFPVFDVKYFKTLLDAGVTGVHFTIPDVNDDLPTAILRIAKWYKTLEQTEDAIIALKVDDIEKAKKEGKVAVICGMQNSIPFERDLDLIRVFHKLGIRVIQLAYYEQNYLGAGCVETIDHGLTDRGKEAVKELNRLGILIDISHCGNKTALDVIETSKYPVAITHATPAALVNIPRAKSDEVIKALAEKGGVMGQVIFSDFCQIRPDVRPTIDDFITAIDYIVNLVGVNHVGLGLDLVPMWTKKDYDEFMSKYPSLGKIIPFEEKYVAGFDSIADIIKITKGLVEHGYSDEEIKKILGGNWLRLLKEVWK